MASNDQISRRNFLLSMAAVAGASLALPGCGAKKSRPNIIVILIDDLGWTDLGCYGSQFYETPNIDRLAAQGMRFTNGYAACTVCSPTRASLLTGKYPARLHLTDWIPGHARPFAKLSVPKFNQELPLEEITIAEALKPAGYVSGHIGKWHLGKEPFYPEKQGFALNLGGTHKGSPPSYFSPYRIPTLKDGPEGEYLTDRLAVEAEEFVEVHKDEPFFLYWSHFAVHTPLQAKKEITEKYERKRDPEAPQNNAVYAAMIESVDQAVGGLMDKLETLGLAEKTIIFFMSDNGGLARVTSNQPLRAGKGSAYEGGVREPMIVKWPGVVEPGSECHTPVMSIDFYPTILEMAGVRPPEGNKVDGLSLVPLLKRQGDLDREALFWHYPHYHPGGATPYSAIRKGDYRLIEFFEDGHKELYNLAEDIGETRDLASVLPDKVRELSKELENWRKDVNAQMPQPNPDYDPVRDREWDRRWSKRRRR